MKVVLQRVSEAEVRVGNESVARIGPGLLLLVAIAKGDGIEQVQTAARRLAELRVFPDQDGRMQHDCRQAGGQVLVVSQFTLAASLKKGRRPSFDAAAEPEVAEPLIDELVALLRRSGLTVECGRFGATMSVSSTNDGPVTFVLDVDGPAVD